MIQKKIAVVDYGIGNLYSVRRALESCGAEHITVTSAAEDILSADKVILPGVGAFADGMKGLKEKNLIEPIIEYARSGKTILGICLGMQLLATVSEEFGLHQGLNLISGRVVPIPTETEKGKISKIPYIGWTNLIEPRANAWERSLLNGLGNNDWVYLVHSFHVQPETESDLLATYDFDGYAVTAAVRTENIYGYQFHPEKSGAVGLRLVQCFLDA